MHLTAGFCPVACLCCSTCEDIRDMRTSEDTNTTSRGVSACSTGGLATGAACRATPLLVCCCGPHD